VQAWHFGRPLTLFNYLHDVDRTIHDGYGSVWSDFDRLESLFVGNGRLLVTVEKGAGIGRIGYVFAEVRDELLGHIDHVSWPQSGIFVRVSVFKSVFTC
jgi:hypothetical protein